MCIAVWTLEHPEYALILSTNRDEYLDRPTQSAHFHSFTIHPSASDGPSGSILSGLDKRAGGTWLGISRAGRVALLTNITEDAANFGTSRGSLVSSFLLSDASLPLEQEALRLAPPDAKFSGFNLMLFAPLMKSDDSLSYQSLLVTNHGAGGVLASRPLSEDERRCGGVSNGIDGAGGTEWPKVKRATQDFDAVLQSLSPDYTEAELVNRLMDVLAWTCPEPVTERIHLRKTVHVLPLSLRSSESAPPMAYATRLSTVILVLRNGDVRFYERDVWQWVGGQQPIMAPPSSIRVFKFKLDI